MNKIILIVIILASFSLGILLDKLVLTGQVIQTQEQKLNTFTTAVCNSQNQCADVLVTCQNKIPIKVELVSNTIINLPEDWQDPRTNISLCE